VRKGGYSWGEKECNKRGGEKGGRERKERNVGIAILLELRYGRREEREIVYINCC